MFSAIGEFVQERLTVTDWSSTVEAETSEHTGGSDPLTTMFAVAALEQTVPAQPLYVNESGPV
jgi:hypothetical protein